MLPRTYGCEELGQRGSELLRTPLQLTSVNKSKKRRVHSGGASCDSFSYYVLMISSFPASLPFSGQRKRRNGRSESIRSMGVPYLHISDALEQGISDVLFGIA